MKYIKSLTLTALLTAFFLASPVWAADQAPKEIKVGTLYAGSGPYTDISLPVLKGLKLWVSQVNAHGGAYVKAYDKKIPIKLIAYNDRSSTETAANLYNRLITQDHVDILTADTGSVLTSVAVPTAKEHKQLLFDQTGTSNKFFSPDNRYIVQVSIPITSRWSTNLAGFLIHEAKAHGVHRVAILYATNDFTGVQANVLHKLLKRADDGPKVVYFHGVPTSTSNYNVLIRRIQTKKPDAVIEMGYPNNDIPFLKALRSSGNHFRMVFAIFPGLETAVMEKNLGSDLLDGVFTYAPPTVLDYKPTIGMDMDAFSQAYHAKYGKDEPVQWNSTAGYTTGIVIQKVLATSKSMDQLDMRKAAFELSGNAVTLVGPFRLNKNGAQIGEPMDIGQLQRHGDGVRNVPIYPSEVAKGKASWRSK